MSSGPLEHRAKSGVEKEKEEEAPMPSKSAQQHRFMEAAAHNATFAKKAGIPQKVANELVAADKTAKRTSSKRSGKERKA